MITYIGGILLGYMIGSFPTAFLLVKWKAHRDIRSLGSGSVGAMNTFDVTGSKSLAAAVLIVDLLKGVVSVWLASIIFMNELWIAGAGGIGAVLGHNYSPWLKFKGGRGLATAAGVLLLLGWICVILWCSVWVGVNLVIRNIHLANVVASISAPLALFLVPRQLVITSFVPDAGFSKIVFLCLTICSLTLLRHIEPMVELIRAIKHPYSES